MFTKQFTRFVRWIGYDLGISPNQITLGRLLFFVPGWFLWIYMHEIGAWAGIWWRIPGFIALALVTTVILFDIVDGALARETGQVSKEGKALDPAVDKFITYSTLALFWPVIDRIGLIILFILDIASTFLREVAVQGANEFGKKKALSQNLSKLFFGMAVLASLPQLNKVGNLLIWIAVVLATISVGIRIIPEKAKHPICLLIPQLITFCNFFCGLLAIGHAFQDRIQIGVLFIFAAMGFDLSDGAVARRLGVTSQFGKYFDTVADLVSFGIGPAILFSASSAWSAASMVIGCIYIIATGVRLYDYGRSKDITPKGFFRGFPSPAAAWLVISTILCLPPGWSLPVVVLAAILMCSFVINWQHFSRMLPSLMVLELIASLVIGIIPAIAITPLGFMTGPILVYVFSPIWRKPPSGVKTAV